LERLTKLILYGTLATIAPLYNISTLCNRNKKQTYNFREKLKEPHVAREPRFGHPWRIWWLIGFWTGYDKRMQISRRVHSRVPYWMLYI